MGNPAFCRDQYLVEAHGTLSRYLFRCFGWVTTKTITTNTGLDGRTIRAVCQMYPSVYVSSTEGYKHHSRASKREIQYCVETLLGRAEKITARASALTSRLL